MEAILDHSDVDVDDVALLELLVARDAVAHLMVDRGADGTGEAFVVERGRHRLLHVDDVVVAEPVERVGGHARLHVRRDHLQYLGREPAGHAHFLYFFRAFQGDGHVGRFGESRYRAPILGDWSDFKKAYKLSSCSEAFERLPEFYPRGIKAAPRACPGQFLYLHGWTTPGMEEVERRRDQPSSVCRKRTGCP